MTPSTGVENARIRNSATPTPVEPVTGLACDGSKRVVTG